MPIPPKYTHRYAYHFSHIDNLPGLLKTGFLANNHPQFPKKNRSIAAPGIQQRRAEMAVTCGPGGCVHDYVPLYFGSRSLMLLSVINAKNVDQMDILYFEFPITLLEEADAVFTDASANTACPPNFFDDPADLAELNWDAIDSLRWSERDEATRHQRMAELLVYNQLPLVDASRCVVWNEDAKKRVQEIVGDAAFPKIAFESPDRRHWYTGFQEKSKSSVVKGPREIAMIFEAACDAIAKERGKHIATATFANLKALRSGLKADFGCLSHTSELVGLASANGMHKHTVDVHTKEVVDKLLSLEEFEALDEREQRLVEIAAFLHDIGKGPRTRWDANGGVQKVDPNHPVGAMPMMVDILTNKVGTLTQSSAEVLAKLVCYHDLVGDVLGRGRDEQQIIDIVASKSELDMLFALGRADIEALSETWWDDDDAESLYGRCLAAVEKKNNT